MTTNESRLWLLAVAVAAVVAVGSFALAAQTAPPIQSRVTAEHRHRADHDAMMDRMRVDVSPAMVEEMRSDDVWRMMRHPSYVRMMEEEQAGLDRMLGRNPAPSRP